jgi:glycosyltransferase involved in cell wall biosynthesis
MSISVTVVIPNYNRFDYTVKAITSALNQTVPISEIIVVDDASTDFFESRIFEDMDPRVRLIRHMTNRGGSAARNTGIDAASGAWLALLDSDDRWLPNKLEKQFEAIRDAKGTRYFACGNVLMDSGRELTEPYNHRPPREGEDISEYFLLHFCTFQTSTLLMPKDIAKKTRFDESLRRHQDWDFVLRLIEDEVMPIYIHEPLTIYHNWPDDKRVSREKRAGPTLDWIEKSQDRISARGAAYFYTYYYFPRHFLVEPFDALRSCARLAMKGPEATIGTLRGGADRFVEIIQSKIAGNRP